MRYIGHNSNIYLLRRWWNFSPPAKRNKNFPAFFLPNICSSFTLRKEVHHENAH